MDAEFSVKIVELNFSERAWNMIVNEVCGRQGWFPYADLTKYEHWKKNLESVGSFWTSQGKRLAILIAEVKGEIAGLVRVLRVPIFSWQRDIWQDSGGSRGEIQDLLILRKYLGTSVGRSLIHKATEVVKKEKLTKIGASNWVPKYQSLFEEQGFKPYSRSILMGWKMSIETSPLPRNRKIKVKAIRLGQEDLVRKVFLKTWGIWVSILPKMDVHHPLVAMLGDEPVGTVLLNKASGNMDLGVQVVPEQRRKYVGTTLLVEALTYFREAGFDEMYVVRNIGREKLRLEDERAIKFYESTGGCLIREYMGMKLMI